MKYKITVDGVIAGGYTIVPNGSTCRLELLFLHPKWMGKGVGLQVWKHIENACPEAKRWILETTAYSRRNHYFYTEKCGLHFLRKIPYENGEASYLFEKIIEEG